MQDLIYPKIEISTRFYKISIHLAILFIYNTIDNSFFSFQVNISFDLFTKFGEKLFFYFLCH